MGVVVVGSVLMMMMVVMVMVVLVVGIRGCFGRRRLLSLVLLLLGVGSLRMSDERWERC